MSRFQKPIYLVTGMHRSGTSCVAELLISAGFYGGKNFIPPADDNPRGFFEDRDFINLNEKILGDKESSWLDIKPEFRMNSKAIVSVEGKKLLDSMLKSAGDKKLILKDPRLCRLLPLWASVFSDFKLVYCIRSPMAVVASLQKRNGLNKNHALGLWYAYNLDLIQSILKFKIDHVLVSYDSLVSLDRQTIKRLADFIDSPICSETINPDLNHNNIFLDESKDSFNAVLYDKANILWNYLSAAEVIRKDFAMFELIDFLPALALLDVGRSISANLIGTKNKQIEDAILYNKHLEFDIIKIKKDLSIELDQKRLVSNELKKIKIYTKHLEKDVSNLNQQLNNESKQNCALVDELKEAQVYTKHLEKDISNLNQQLNNESKQNCALVDELKEAQVYTKHLEKDISNLNQQLNNESKQNCALVDELKKAQVYTKHLEKDVSNLNQQLFVSRKQQKDLKFEIDSLKKSLKEKITDNKHLQVELYDIDKEKNILTASILELNGQLDEQSRTLEEWGQYIPHVEKDIMLLKRAIDEQQENFEHFKLSPLLLMASTVRAIIWRLYNFPSAVTGWYKSGAKGLGKAITAFYESYYRKMNSWGSSKKNGKSMQKMVAARSEVPPTFHQRKSGLQLGFLPEITVSVVTHNNGRWINGFMLSLENQSYDLKKIHLIFVDNASDDGTVITIKQFFEYYQSQFASLRLYQRPNEGFGRGHDFSIKQAETEFVLVANVDIEFKPDSINLCVNCAISDDKHVASWEFRQQPYEHPKFVDPVALTVNWSSHACILIRKKAYQAVGGYEKRIFMYGEDVELSYRFRREGWLLRYVPAAVVAHYTYAEEAEVKPLQFLGSTKANLLIRCRYGDSRDVIAGFMQYFYICFKDAGFEGSAKRVRKEMPKNLLDAGYMLFSRKKSSEFFPFRGFDYDMVRDGAFYTCADNLVDNLSLPLVSVITRTVEGRNGLLRQAILSVRNQTYPNIEHVIVQDGGDGTKEVVSEFELKNVSGYSLNFISCSKKGRSYAGNRGMTQAKGQYLVFLDDDDLLFPDHVEQLMTAVLENQVPAAYSLSWEVHTDMRDKLAGDYLECSHTTPSVFRQEFCKKILSHHNYIPIQSILFDKKLFDKYGGFEEDMDCLEDWVLWKKYALDNTFIFVPKTTSLFRTPANEKERQERTRYFHKFYESAEKMYRFEEV